VTWIAGVGASVVGAAARHRSVAAGGPDARLQFIVAANGDSFEDIPPGPPSVSWTESVEGGAK
jgi:hypothetical protein